MKKLKNTRSAQLWLLVNKMIDRKMIKWNASQVIKQKKQCPVSSFGGQPNPIMDPTIMIRIFRSLSLSFILSLTLPHTLFLSNSLLFSLLLFHLSVSLPPSLPFFPLYLSLSPLFHHFFISPAVNSSSLCRCLYTLSNIQSWALGFFLAL